MSSGRHDVEQTLCCTYSQIADLALALSFS